jgi:hypothetical protein
MLPRTTVWSKLPPVLEVEGQTLRDLIFQKLEREAGKAAAGTFAAKLWKGIAGNDAETSCYGR